MNKFARVLRNERDGEGWRKLAHHCYWNGLRLPVQTKGAEMGEGKGGGGRVCCCCCEKEGGSAGRKGERWKCAESSKERERNK